MEILDCGSHSPALSDIFLSSDPSICSTIAFHPLGNSGYDVVLVPMDFFSNSKKDAPFHYAVYDYSQPDWDGLCDHLRDAPCQTIFKLDAFVAAAEFFESVQVGIDLFIPHPKYRIKPHPSPWFSATCAATIAHRITS